LVLRADRAVLNRVRRIDESPQRPPPARAAQCQYEDRHICGGQGMSKQTHDAAASATGSILDFEGLDVTFSTDGGDVHAVKDVSLSVSPGEVLAIVGESGSGKTVTARSILGLLPETAQRSGAVVISGKNVLSVSAEQLRAMRGSDVAMVFQEPSTALNPVYTVGWQIAEGLRAHDKKASKAELKTRVVAAMEQVGIPDAQ